MSRAQSPISDTNIVDEYEVEEAPAAEPSDIERLAKAYPKFANYIEQVITKYQRFHPSGTPVEGLTEEERVKWWASAVVIVNEFEFLRNIVIANTKKKK